MQSNKTIIITTAILTLMILGAGCTDTGGANPSTTTYTPPPEEVPVVEETAATEPIPEPEPVETHWYDGRSNYVYGVHDTDLYGTVEGAKNIESISDGFYTISYDSKNLILIHQDYTPSNIALHNELSPDQYKALVSEYGSMRHLTMETIDLDQDGAMDKVAVKYVGSDGVLEFETNPMRRADGSLANVGVQSYLGEYLYEN